MKAGLSAGLAVIAIVLCSYYVLSSQNYISQKQDEYTELSREKASMDQEEKSQIEKEETEHLYEGTQDYKDLAPYRTVHIPLRFIEGSNEEPFDMEVELVNFIGNDDKEWRDLQLNFKKSVDNACVGMSSDAKCYLYSQNKMYIYVSDKMKINQPNLQTFIENFAMRTLISIYLKAGYDTEQEIRANPLRLRVFITIYSMSAKEIVKGGFEPSDISYYAPISW